MGSTYVVEVFTIDEGYKEYWRGEELLEALCQLSSAKDAGCKCIKLEYRPA